jgi:hypothetical protein
MTRYPIPSHLKALLKSATKDYHDALASYAQKMDQYGDFRISSRRRIDPDQLTTAQHRARQESEDRLWQNAEKQQLLAKACLKRLEAVKKDIKQHVFGDPQRRAVIEYGRGPNFLHPLRNGPNLYYETTSDEELPPPAGPPAQPPRHFPWGSSDDEADEGVIRHEAPELQPRPRPGTFAPDQSNVIQDLNRKLIDAQTAEFQAVRQNANVAHLLDLERQKANIFRTAVLATHLQSGTENTELRRRYQLHRDGVDNFRQMMKYYEDHVQPTLRQTREEAQERIKYYIDRNVDPKENGLTWDPSTESWVPQ